MRRRSTNTSLQTGLRFTTVAIASSTPISTELQEDIPVALEALDALAAGTEGDLKLGR